MKIRSIKQIPNDIVYAMETTTGTFIADGVYHHNCAYDNAWLDKEEMLQRYRNGIIDKYGRDTLKELKARAKITRTNKREELEQVIHDSKVEVAHMMEHAENYMV